MKKIYTSNYARCGSNPNAIGISCTVPQWFSGARLPDLAPEWNMVDSIKKGLLDEQQYTSRYIKLLRSRRIDPTLVYNNLPDGTILLCYESPGDFCHRRILAEWIFLDTEILIPEWKSPEELKQDEQNDFVDSLLDF